MDIDSTAQKLWGLTSNIHVLFLKSYAEWHAAVMKPSRRAMTFVCVIAEGVSGKSSVSEQLLFGESGGVFRSSLCVTRLIHWRSCL